MLNFPSKALRSKNIAELHAINGMVSYAHTAL